MSASLRVVRRTPLTAAGAYAIIMLCDISGHIIERGACAIIADRKDMPPAADGPSGGTGAAQGPMTEAMYYILLALLKPGHGYGMMQRIRELSGGRLEMGPGTLYGVLSRMNKEGLITFTGEEGRRKNYAITEAGREALLAEYGRLKRLVADGKLLEAGTE